MGPSKKKRADAQDERRQYAADNYVRAAKADKKAEAAEKKQAARDKKGGKR